MAGRLEALLARERSARVGGLYGASLGWTLAWIAGGGTPLLVVVAEPKAAETLRLDLDALLPRPSLPFPIWPRETGHAAPDADVLQARAQVLARLHQRRRKRAEHPVVVTTLSALVQPVPGASVVEAGTLHLHAAEERPRDVLAEHLAAAGYARVGAVEVPGEFSAHGGVLDVWPWGADAPARLDFFGDEIESLCAFDPASQRSRGPLEDLALPTLPPERFKDPHGAEGASFLTAHLAEDARIVLVEPDVLVGAATSLRTSGGSGAGARVADLERELGEHPSLLVSAMPVGGRNALDVSVESVDALRGITSRRRRKQDPPKARAARMAGVFRELGTRADRVVVHRRAAGEEERLRELLAEQDIELDLTFVPGSLSRSFVWMDTRVAHVAYDDLADVPIRERRGIRKGPPSRPIQDFLELVEGAPVVHLHHGIGMFRGLSELEGPDGMGEFLKLEFAEGTIVYVPVARIDLVQRYVGTGRTPRLSKVGGTEWSNRKKKVSEAVEELAEDLLATQAERHRRTGPPLPSDSEWQHEFEAAFPYPATPDQVAAVRAIKEDLESDQPMDRLLCGDVGYGKTEVALRALFKVIASGRQAAVLVPTKVLAQQHVRVFTQRLAPYPLTVRGLSTLQSPAENRAVVEGLAEGHVDLVVGTHRLLSKDVTFHDLGLVVIDEEQRFGVKHKERLKSLRSEVDVLALSATPIPRTLHMALLGIRDISNLTTPPLGRHPIDTQVLRESDEILHDAIRRELDRGGQLFMVSSRIAELPQIAARLMRLVPELRVVVIHGRMDKHMVEQRMLRFVRGEADLMLATTIIESGLDIPNANTIILRDADRYGLAELHQLRGRVGRERRRAHAVVLLPQGRPLSDEAAERLKAIEEYSELGAGFRIAMRDLEIRGAGNLLGPQQSGHIASVGYDLYCSMLAEAVEQKRGETRRRPVQLAFLGVDVPAGIPDDYIEDMREKFRIYRRVAATKEDPDLRALREELEDRFGRPPSAVKRLLLCQRARILGGRIGIERFGPGPSDQPGIVLHAPEGVLRRLKGPKFPLRSLNPGQAFLPTPKAEGEAAIVQRLVQLLEAEG